MGGGNIYDVRGQSLMSVTHGQEMFWFSWGRVGGVGEEMYDVSGWWRCIIYYINI